MLQEIEFAEKMFGKIKVLSDKLVQKAESGVDSGLMIPILRQLSGLCEESVHAITNSRRVM